MNLLFEIIAHIVILLLVLGFCYLIYLGLYGLRRRR